MRLGLRRQMIVCPRMTSLRLRFFGLVLDTQIIQRAGHTLTTLLGVDGIVVQARLRLPTPKRFAQAGASRRALDPEFLGCGFDSA